MQTRESAAEERTESELDLGESIAPEPGSGPGGHLPLGLTVRRLQGTAAVVGFVVIVSAAVIGGTLAVDSVARFDGDRSDSSSVLEEDLDGVEQTPTTQATATSDTDGKQATKKDGTSAKASKSSTKTATAKTSTATATSGTSGGGSGSGSGASKTSPLSGTGTIVNLTTGQCVDLPGSGDSAPGTGVDQYTCLPGTDNQEFELVDQSGLLLIRNVKSNYCLDLAGTGSSEIGAVVVVDPCQAGSSDNQMWRAKAQGDGFYLVNVKSGLCLDVSNSNDQEREQLGQILTLYTCRPDDDHVWVLA